WIMGGRFVEQRVLGNFGGMKFEGAGVTGYDNLGKKYKSAWIDNMGTNIETSQGSVSDDGKTFTFGSESLCPLTKQMLKGREEIKIVDSDKYVATFYKNFEKDIEVKVMEITYTRKAK